LTIAIEADRTVKRPNRSSGPSIRCFMCVEEGHSLRDCPETRAFIAKKILKYTNEGRLIKFDGSDLPCGDMSNGSVARVL
jgi:hypothetical protein